MTARADSPSLRLRARGVLGGAAILTAAQILSRLFTMVFTLAIARLLTVGDFGSVNLALSMVVVFALIQDLGISRTVVKEIARRPDDAAHWIGRLLPAKLVLGGIAAVAMPAIAALSGYGRPMIGLLVVASAFLPIGAVWLLLENATQAIGAVRLLATVTVVNAVLQTAIGLAAALAWGGEPHALVAAMGAANLAGMVTLWRLLARRVGRIVPTLDLAFLRTTIAASLPYLTVAVAVAAIGRVELLLLARLAGEVPAGVFAAAFKIFEATLFVLYAMQIAMNPILARLVGGDRAVLQRWLDWEFGVLAAGIVPVGTAAWLLAGPLVALLYPAGYAAAGDVLAVLGAALPIVGVQVFTAGVLMLTDRQRAVMALNLAVLAAQVGLALALIPRWGAVGAAVSLACSQGCAAALGLVLTSRLVAGPGAFATFFRMLAGSAAAVGAGLAARAVAGDGAGIALALAVAACCMPLAKVRLLPPH